MAAAPENTRWHSGESGWYRLRTPLFALHCLLLDWHRSIFILYDYLAQKKKGLSNIVRKNIIHTLSAVNFPIWRIRWGVEASCVRKYSFSWSIAKVSTVQTWTNGANNEKRRARTIKLLLIELLQLLNFVLQTFILLITKMQLLAQFRYLILFST